MNNKPTCCGQEMNRGHEYWHCFACGATINPSELCQECNQQRGHQNHWAPFGRHDFVAKLEADPDNQVVRVGLRFKHRRVLDTAKFDGKIRGYKDCGRDGLVRADL